jgi:hypothetical protein
VTTEPIEKEMDYGEISLSAVPYLQFGIPGLPYSAVRIPLVEDLAEMDDWVARAMNAAQLLANAYREAFEEAPQPAPRPQPRPAPQQPQRTNGAPQRARVAPSKAPAAVAGSGAYCPEHPNVEAIPSKGIYAKFEEDEFGNEVQANYFCPGAENGTGKNHTLWRRQLVWPEPDAAPY